MSSLHEPPPPLEPWPPIDIVRRGLGGLDLVLMILTAGVIGCMGWMIWMGFLRVVVTTQTAR